MLKIHNINTFVGPEDRVVNPIKCLSVICIVKIVAISGRANKTNDSVCKGNNVPPKLLIVTVTSHQVVRKIVEVV